MPPTSTPLRHQLGLRLQRLRQRHGLSQAELARRLGLSPSYLNQIERNQRPLTLAIQQRLKAELGDLYDLLDADAAAALVEPLDETLRTLGQPLSATELRMLSGNLPQVAQVLLDLHRAHRQLLQRTAALEVQLGAEHAALPSLSPGDQVRDYFNRAHNYLPELDEHAEALYAELGLSPDNLPQRLRQRLADRHGLWVRDTAELQGDKRQLDAQARVLWLPAHLRPGQQAFQMAAHLALLECNALLDARIADAGFEDAERVALSRIGLSNYFAGALVMPYTAFLHSAQASRYDIEWLADRFGVGFEAVCHRLSTLQRRDATGLPIFFMRVDRAGNVSKRHSATDFHFSHVGGACPLWIVYEAFNQPDRILTQIARMPDGRRYFWVARQVSSGAPGYGRPRKTFALAMGCDLRHADQLVYARGWDLHAVDDAVPIGPGCLTCERSDCAQRAFPALPRLRSTITGPVAPT
ncbi:helix-turn-helix domain-containing protein [Xanthomonas maliensis]|uniref:helix-turn-helix domain-containing protein n=1 Tax=Xanthomonas maliensis TaxID=1321368 RepID=UPI0004CE36E0|nr:short-chain fatty acyl-CoA regulator family protein [Xanthomonas maliensis]KAB7767221.1 XRE family transcriptional regulator [Xanthomonas maliensis]